MEHKDFHREPHTHWYALILSPWLINRGEQKKEHFSSLIRPSKHTLVHIENHFHHYFHRTTKLPRAKISTFENAISNTLHITKTERKKTKQGSLIMLLYRISRISLPNNEQVIGFEIKEKKR